MLLERRRSRSGSSTRGGELGGGLVTQAAVRPLVIMLVLPSPCEPHLADNGVRRCVVWRGLSERFYFVDFVGSKLLRSSAEACRSDMLALASFCVPSWARWPKEVRKRWHRDDAALRPTTWGCEADGDSGVETMNRLTKGGTDRRLANWFGRDCFRQPSVEADGYVRELTR